MITLEELVRMKGRELDRAMREGHAIDPRALDDREYEGVSLNLPRFVMKLTWVKFEKTFCRDEDGSLRGWNCRAVQTPLDAPWELATKNGAPITFGHYRVVATDAYRMPRPYGAGLMLDYADAGNPRLDPTSFVRDPIVAVNEGSAELLLGWTYLELGVRVPTPSFFALRRGRPLSHRVRRPRDVVPRLTAS